MFGGAGEDQGSAAAGTGGGRRLGQLHPTPPVHAAIIEPSVGQGV